MTGIHFLNQYFTEKTLRNFQSGCIIRPCGERAAPAALPEFFGENLPTGFPGRRFLIINSNKSNTACKETPLTFRIVDAPMGIGKSDVLIRLIRRHWSSESAESRRFIIFVSTIRERDLRFMPELNLKTPDTHPYNKTILEMIRNGDNIVATHSLWSIFSDETLKAFRESKYKYIAFFDEAPPLFRDTVGLGRKLDETAGDIRFGPEDVKLMQRENMIFVKDGQIRFNNKCNYDKSKSGYKVFNAVKYLTRSCTLYPYGENDGDFTSIIAFARRELFSCFCQCWIFSYLTYDNMLHKYCLLNHIHMEYYLVDERYIMRTKGGKYVETYPAGIERLVILDGSSFNSDASLSKRWYADASRDRSRAGLDQLERQCRNAYDYMKKHGVRSKTFMYTVFNAYRHLLRSDGRHFPTQKRFLPCNTKATNDFSDCNGVAYLCNRYFDINCTNFLSQRAEAENRPELKFNDDVYALSELVQFIWRSNVRRADSYQPVYVYVPSRRMRTLLQDFQERARKRKEESSVFHMRVSKHKLTAPMCQEIAKQKAKPKNALRMYLYMKYFRFAKG